MTEEVYQEMKKDLKNLCKKIAKDYGIKEGVAEAILSLSADQNIIANRLVRGATSLINTAITGEDGVGETRDIENNITGMLEDLSTYIESCVRVGLMKEHNKIIEPLFRIETED